MLSHIHIRDFAIIDELELDLRAGMSALTGETGAGKSILVDALGLALGDRADSAVVRHGAERAEISAAFEISDSDDAASWLQDQELASDGECMIRRVITREGRSRAFINGRPVPIQSLKELGQQLVDIHGQHEHQSLLRRDTQRALLDDYAGNGALVDELRSVYDDWKKKSQELERLRSASEDRTARTDLLRFQVQELEQLDLAEDELPSLNEEHSRLAHAGQLLETCQSAVATLYENEETTAHAQLSRVATQLEPLCDIDAQLGSARDMLNDALIQVREATDELRHYADRLDLDPQRLQWVEQRLGSIQDLSRKHHVSPEELPALLTQLRSELDGLDNADERLDQLQSEMERLRKRYEELARKLSRKRSDGARELNRRVTEVIQGLGMGGARFEISVQSAESTAPAPTGMDAIEFSVSTNPGQPLQPLSKIASGGELSRFSLAIQVVLAHTTRISTLIYDEVDTGIGGAVAEVVGQRLRGLGESRQVLCVTHLPQVAAQAHNHLRITKQSAKNTTRTGIESLDESERVEEVARMLGGVEISEQTRAHAREMIQRAGADPGKGAKARKKTAARKKARTGT